MKRLLLLSIFAFFSEVSPFSGGYRRNDIHRLPPGSYLNPSECGDSCKMIQGRLVCDACVISPEERVTKTLFNVDECPVESGRFDIVNDSERDLLKCLPRGSYMASCGNCKMINDDLTCQGCYLRTGEPLQLLNNEIRLNNVSRCKYDIVNNNGQLRCLPQGQYLDYCDCVIVNGQLRCRCAANGRVQNAGLKNVDYCQPGTIRYTGDRLICTPKRTKGSSQNINQ